METSKIIKDQKQTRTTIPSKLVKEAGVDSGHMAEWKIKGGRLNMEVMTHEEFVKKVAETQRIENKTKKHFEDKK